MSPFRFLHLSGGPRLPMIMQSETSECGLACLAMVASYHGHALDMTGLRHRFAVSIKGMTLKTLFQMAERLGLSGRGLKLEPKDLGTLRLPAILHWDMNHFVVLKEIRGQTAIVHDPAAGVRRLTLAQLSQHFTGLTLELIPTRTFEKKTELRKLSVSALCGRIDGFRHALGQALALSFILQIFVLASPFYMQLAIDEAVLQGDQGLMVALAVGFGLLTAIKLAADGLRARVLLLLGNVVNYQMVVNLFHHLIRLPLDWFGKRHMGDILSRFGSTKPITDLVAEGLVAAIVDGVMGALTLVMIFLYSPWLALIVLVAQVLHMVLRLVGLGPLRRREEETIHAMAREQTSFIETARAMQAIKLFAQEEERENLWQARYAEVINRKAGFERLQTGLRIAGDLLMGLENILVVYVGARLAIAGDMTVGMLFAFMSYKQQFLDKTSKLVETAIKFRLLDLHLARLADIVFAERERTVDQEPLFTRPVEGALSLRGVTYRYADTEPAVFSDVDLTIAPGEFVAITGPSGTGKSTLLRVMLGLLAPTSGEILVDGRPLDAAGMAAFRQQVGVVMQDDHLLSGSIAENISFFDPRIDITRLREAARIAGIDDEIMAMPMNYNTQVGDMGTGLSGGQRQRIFLARALYRRPQILFMDEGTSHLDKAREIEINQALCALNITRVVIAHRSETLAAASRVLTFEGGQVRERPQPSVPQRAA